jgi:UDP-N-acetylmuramate dehydrogenase
MLPTPEHQVDLRPYNSFGLPAKAPALLRVRSELELQRWAQQGCFRQQSILILGGGTNTLFTPQFGQGQTPFPLVLKVEIPGKRLLGNTSNATWVEAGAGETWQTLVDWTLKQGCPGLENLAGIPGTVGAAPVQNIGAYGLELQDRLHGLYAVHLPSGEHRFWSKQDCQLAYRDSVFKHPQGQGWLITRVCFRLPKPWVPLLAYKDLAQSCAGLSALAMAQKICEIRQSKLPNPEVLGNAGSFFKNPLVEAEQLQTLLSQYPALVHYPLANGKAKLAAGWLIEACGWKGYPGNKNDTVGVYERQALVLVNRGGATGADVLALAERIQASVQEKFGVKLEPEPVVA